MKVCGIDIKGSQANLVILENEGGSYKHVNIDPKKIKLDDDESTEDVRSFRDVFQAIIREQQIKYLGIKKRNKTGKYAGGPISFKIEGILQLMDACQIHLVSPVTISSVIKKLSPKIPDTLFSYQKQAFETALTILERQINA